MHQALCSMLGWEANTPAWGAWGQARAGTEPTMETGMGSPLLDTQ